MGTNKISFNGLMAITSAIISRNPKGDSNEKKVQIKRYFKNTNPTTDRIMKTLNIVNESIQTMHRTKFSLLEDETPKNEGETDEEYKNRLIDLLEKDEAVQQAVKETEQEVEKIRAEKHIIELTQKTKFQLIQCLNQYKKLQEGNEDMLKVIGEAEQFLSSK